jgi:hypothetical protein
MECWREPICFRIAPARVSAIINLMADPDPLPVDPEYAYRNELHTIYREQRSEADRVALEIGGRYEKMLSLIAGGALAVSVTFIEKLAPSPVPWSKWVALLAWMLLCGSILASLVAIAASQRAQQQKIRNLDLEISQRLYPDNEEFKGKDATLNPFVAAVERANKVSLWGAILGLIALVSFVFVNFPSRHSNEAPKTDPAESRSDSAQQRQDQLLRSDGEPGKAAAPNSATPAKPNEEKPIVMSQEPQPSPQTTPKPSGSPLTESYVPTNSPVAPPPPNTPPKGNK